MSITPHIVVQGAERAGVFYRDALSAEEIRRIPTPDGRLMSLQLRIGDAYVHLADEFPEMGVLAPPSIGGTSVVLALEVDDAEAVFAQAVAAGAEVASRSPKGSSNWPCRSPQNTSASGWRTSAPAATACANTASASSTSSASTTEVPPTEAGRARPSRGTRRRGARRRHRFAAGGTSAARRVWGSGGSPRRRGRRGRRRRRARRPEQRCAV